MASSALLIPSFKLLSRPVATKETRVFDALEWLAAIYSHVPDKGEQMVRYYGHYSNKSRGRRAKAET